jgi:hypothetical protein
MSWNYRFIEFKTKFLNEDDTYIELCEVYYDADGMARMYSKPHLIFDNLNQVEFFLDKVKEALNKPCLKEIDFLNREDKNDPWHCDFEAEE